ALALDEIGYMAQAPDMLDGLLRGAQSLSGVAAGASIAASNPYVRFGLAAASALAAGATNLRGLADDFTAAELRDILEAGYSETTRQTEFRITDQLRRLNDLERRRAEFSQLPMIRRQRQMAAPATPGDFQPSMRREEELPAPAGTP